MHKKPVIALLTDFGLKDGYVGSMKASIFNIQPHAQLIDISHQIEAQNVLEASFLLTMVFQDYPKDTIFTCVVDPGVGSDRKALLIKTKFYIFIGPDNGLFDLVLEKTPALEIISLENNKYFNETVSSTFHGRDIFAPCAAWLSRGVKMSEFGPLYQEERVRLSGGTILKSKDEICGILIYADVFGNLISNIHRDHMPLDMASFTVSVNNVNIPVAKNYTLEGEGLIALWGSSGYLEISWPGGNAAEKSGLKGEKVELRRST